MAATKRAKPQTAKRAAAPAKKQKSVKRAAAPVKKQKPVVRAAKRTAGRARSAKAAASAAPLLATAPKKVGKVAAKATGAVKPSAPYQPKTDIAAITPPVVKTATKQPRTGTAPAAFDPFALARPWMWLGFRMTVANLSLQARVTRAAMDMPPAAAALRHSAAAYRAWLALLGGAQPAKG